VGANQGSIAPLVDRLGEILSLPSERDSYMVVNALARTGLVRGDYVGLEKLEKAVAEQASQRSDLAKLILPIKIKALTKQKKYAEAKKLVLEHAGELGDSGLRSLQVGIVRGLVQSGKLDEARKLVKSVYADGAKYPTTLASVGLYWVQKAIDDKQAGEFVSRVDELSGAGCSVDHFAFVFRDGFYTVMQSGDRDAINKCSAQLEKFTKTEGLHESTLQVLALLMLDGAFYRNDFKAAYEMVERGVPGYDEKWHAEMRDKVGAHLALQEERYADAIELFRKHMERVAAWTDPVINPVNGARMTKEAVLGFNEKRLGDIFTKMGDEAEAKAAYARAKEWYNKAIKAASPGSIEEKIAKDELQQVP
jgi:tetratricopeptide (TPR) repeat protein